MKKFLALLSATVLMVTALAVPVSAESETTADINPNELVSAMENLDIIEQEMVAAQALDCANGEDLDIPEPQAFEGDGFRATRSGNSASIKYESHMVNVDLASKQINADVGDTNISISFDANSSSIIPAGNHSMLVPDQTGTYATGIKVSQDSVRNYTLLNSEKAPKTYSSTVSMPDGYYLELAKDEETGETDGSYNIYSSNNELVGFIDSPTAYDANGAAVPVETTLSGNVFSYTYDVDSSYTAFPVASIVPFSATSDWTAHYKPYPDPSRGWVENYSPKWGRSLCFYQTGWASKWQSTASKNTKWAALYNYWSPDKQWYNTNGMKDQWTCHVSWGAIVNKSEWNLEPGRPNDKASITNLCNPGGS